MCLYEELDLGLNIFPVGKARLLLAAPCNGVLLLDVGQSFIPLHGE